MFRDLKGGIETINRSDSIMTTVYKVSALPVTPDPFTIQKFVALRLLALRTDPSSFGSTYEREIAFTEEQWRARLSAKSRITFIASIDQPYDNGIWVATATILAPSDLTFGALAPLRDVGVGGDIYVLVGMWTMPEHRRRGVGKALIELAVKWIKMRESKIEDVWLALQVAQGNDVAVEMYTSVGFRTVATHDTEEGWMIVPVGEYPF